MAWGGALTAVALLAAWWALSALLSDFVERRLWAELAAQALGIVAAAEWAEEDGRMLLRQAVRRGLLGAVALVVERRAIGRPLGLPADGLHDGRPRR
jgi:hypothetical protein